MKFVVIGGSLRQASFNRRLMDLAAKLLEAEGHTVLRIEGADLEMPLINPDKPVPEQAAAIGAALLEANGAFLASPEYNLGMPAHLKNVLDWTSRIQPNPWKGLPVLLACATPGAFGGHRGLMPWRTSLSALGAFVCPSVVGVPHADKALAEPGQLADGKSAQALEDGLMTLMKLASALGTSR
ncbi:MAG TPA: NADPH-dependent FMN reductase [Holophagaceae bacterium]|jgi:chromate reductase|nr:NADPH-dependent FMN reductase [Holophagaceae bacterium]